VRSKVRDLFERHYGARGWRSARRHYEDLLSRLIDDSATVLEIGCGHDTRMAEQLVSLAREVHGADPAWVEDCCHAMIRTVASAYALPYADESFDVVTCKCVLEHLKEPLSALKEVGRVLKDDGLFVFLTPSRYDYVSLISRVIPNRLHPSIVRSLEGRSEPDTFPTYYRANSARQLRRLASQAGFDVEMLQYRNHYPYLLRFSPLLFRVGVLYDRLITHFRSLQFLRGFLIGVLKKPTGVSRLRSGRSGQ
jgi:ubiquinone/menaquinone biosynthesis C-methylase UbiE